MEEVNAHININQADWACAIVLNHTDQYPHLFTTSSWDDLTMELAEKAIEF
jgi:hypothetical protein